MPVAMISLLPRVVLGGSEGAVAGQDPVDGGPGQDDRVVAGEVPAQRVGAGVVAVLEELFA
jgi:hypothetical protein